MTIGASPGYSALWKVAERESLGTLHDLKEPDVGLRASDVAGGIRHARNNNSFLAHATIRLR